MKKIFMLKILAILLLTSSCNADTFHYYKDDVHELLRDPKTRKSTENQSNVNDLAKCQLIYQLGLWEISLRKDRILSRDVSSINPSGIIYEGNIYIDAIDGKMNSIQILKDSSYYPIYIGPWQEITLTHSTGFFPFTKTISEKKNIRFFAYMAKEGGNISYQYESMNEENKKIKEKPFSLPTNAKIAPDQFGLCVVKWTAKYGYDAIAEVKSKNSWSKDYLVPTGRIIDSKTGEVIAEKQ